MKIWILNLVTDFFLVSRMHVRCLTFQDKLSVVQHFLFEIAFCCLYAATAVVVCWSFIVFIFSCPDVFLLLACFGFSLLSAASVCIHCWLCVCAREFVHEPHTHTHSRWWLSCCCCAWSSPGGRQVFFHLTFINCTLNWPLTTLEIFAFFKDCPLILLLIFFHILIEIISNFSPSFSSFCPCQCRSNGNLKLVQRTNELLTISCSR